VERLNLAEAYARYGAKLENRLRGLSACAADGSVVLTCETSQLARPGIGILRFEGDIPNEAPVARTSALLREHLTLARDEARRVSMVIVSPSTGRTRNIHIRKDLIGSVASFDGDHYVVDFTRVPQPPRESKVRRKR
jgi:hypothetical protein